MFASRDSVDLFFLDKLTWLLYIDHRRINLKQLLETNGLSSPLGVRGYLQSLHPKLGSIDATASVYAQVGVSLGYIKPTRFLGRDEWKRFIAAIRGWRKRSNVAHDDVLKTVGEPCLEIASTLAYCTRVGGQIKWIHIDFDNRPYKKRECNLMSIRKSDKDFRQKVLYIKEAES